MHGHKYSWGSSLKRYLAGAKARDLFGVERGARLLCSLYIKWLPLLIKSNAQVFEIKRQLELEVARALICHRTEPQGYVRSCFGVCRRCLVAK